MSAMRDRLVKNIGQSLAFCGLEILARHRSSKVSKSSNSSKEFESMGLPAYQHFRPSMRR
jgi:hypothetical protein